MTHKQENNYSFRGFLQRKRVLSPTLASRHKSPALGRKKNSEYLSLKPSRAYFHKTQKVVETGSTLTGYTQNLTCSGIRPQPTRRKVALRPCEPTAAPGHIPAHQMAEDLPPHTGTCALQPDPHGLIETPGPSCSHQ